MSLIKKKKIVNPDVKIDLFTLTFSSAFFTGFFPVASGTFGSAFALLFFLIPGFNELYVLLPAIILCFVVGVFTSGKMVHRFGDDPSVVVIDEVVGMWITILISGFVSTGYLNLIIGFFAFRFFDIVKLYPASYFDKMKNGFGIMMDDVIAGIYGGVLTYLILIVIGKIF